MAAAPETVGPPRTEIGLLGWLKKNLFSTWYNALLSVLAVAIIVFIVRGIVSWAFTGARWGVITTNWRVFLVGRYTSEDPSAIWRIWASLGIVAYLAITTWLVWSRKTRWFIVVTVVGWLLALAVSMTILRGATLTVTRIAASAGIVAYPAVMTWLVWRGRTERLRPLTMVGWFLSFPLIMFILWQPTPTLWSGLLLTLLLAVIGIVASFPLGILLALGRRSDVRGVPLVRTALVAIVWLLLPVLLSAIRGAVGLVPGVTHPPNTPGPTLASVLDGIMVFLDGARSFLLAQISLSASIGIPWSWLVVPVILVIGILLERRQGFPGVNLIKLLCTLYIEVIRGVPLITILFMADLILPLFLPIELRIERVIRAMVGITLFTAAYSAEDVRGGLAAIPNGQYEAARAVGLNNVLTMALIILPQALRAMIPSIVGQFISLFKDTTLVQIIGLLDLLGIAKAVTGQQQWIGTQREIYLVCGVIFFVFCYAMSHASRRLEVSLGVGRR